MPKFALLLPHAPDRYSSLTETEVMDVIKDYVSWVDELEKKGAYAGGYKLTDDAAKTLVAGADGVTVHDGPFAELAEILGGIMVIEAADWDEAVAIARTNPHLEHNKRIELRAVHDV